MKSFFYTLCLLIATSVFSQADGKITIPKGVVYNYANDSIVNKAIELITADIKNSSSYATMGELMIVGPELWKRFKRVREITDIKGGNTVFMVDEDKLDGKMTQNLEDSKIVWNQVRKEIGSGAFVIRKLNEAELRYYWTVISFDIDEPLLIVETGKHRYILNLLKDTMKVLWLDEAP